METMWPLQNMFSVSAEQRMSEEHLVWEQRLTDLAKVTKEECH